jgi:hypothetical protein
MQFVGTDDFSCAHNAHHIHANSFTMNTTNTSINANDRNSMDEHPHRGLCAKSSVSPSTDNHNFPVRLHYAVTAASEDMAAIVSWAPHGRCFIVHKHDGAFVEKFLGW